MFVNFQRRDTAGARQRYAKINPPPSRCYCLQAGVNVAVGGTAFPNRRAPAKYRPADISINSGRPGMRESARPTLIEPPPIAFISSVAFRRASRPLGRPGCIFRARIPSDSGITSISEMHARGDTLGVARNGGGDISRRSRPDVFFEKARDTRANRSLTPRRNRRAKCRHADDTVAHRVCTTGPGA